MSTNIIYPSAAEYWLSHPLKSSLDEFSKPVHVMVPDISSRRKRKDFQYHVRTNDESESRFIRITPDISVSSPELCFLQAALSIKSFPKLVCFANDLCGIYVKDNSMQFQQHGREQVTSTAEIRHFLAQSDGFYGIKQARKAIHYSVDRSNSPIESRLAVLCRLPFRLGGFGIPEPKMNYEVMLSADAKKLLKRKSIRCDMVWPECKVALEYESNLTHLNVEQHGYDKSRATALQLSDYQVIYVTSQDLKSISSVEQLFRVLRNTLGIRTYKEPWIKNQVIRRQVITDLLFQEMF